MTLFGLITVLPSLVLVLFTYFVLDVSLRGWFSDRISTAVEESVTVADAYLEEHILSVRGQILAMANDINREASTLSGNRRQFDAFLTNQSGCGTFPRRVRIPPAGSWRTRALPMP